MALKMGNKLKANFLEKIEDQGITFALIIRNGYQSEGTDFVSEDNWPFQLGFHKRNKDFRYNLHKTNDFKNVQDFRPNKIYLVKKGVLGIDICDDCAKKVKYVQLNQGDLIIFVSGAHGVDILEDATEFIEIKQGPYRGVNDKVFFE